MAAGVGGGNTLAAATTGGVIEYNELVTKVTSENSRPRKGVNIEVTVPAYEISGTAPFSDETRKITYETNLGNTRFFNS